MAENTQMEKLEKSSGTNLFNLAAAEQQIDLSGLNQAQQRMLSHDLATSMAEVRQRQGDLALSLQGMSLKLNSLTGTAQRANDAGVDFTVKNTQEDRSGKTEILMGNSRRAKRGTSLPSFSPRLILIMLGIAALLFFSTQYLRVSGRNNQPAERNTPRANYLRQEAL